MSKKNQPSVSLEKGEFFVAIFRGEEEEEEDGAEDGAEEPDEETPAPAPAEPAKEEKKPEGIAHDPYAWGKCAVTANIVWLPDGTVMAGVRNHLDAPIVAILAGDELTTLPGHAAELPIPTAEAIAEMLSQLREDLPARAQAHAAREEAERKKAEESKTRVSARKAAADKPAPAKTADKKAAAPKPGTVGKAPAQAQMSLFNMMAGGK